MAAARRARVPHDRRQACYGGLRRAAPNVAQQRKGQACAVLGGRERLIIIIRNTTSERATLCAHFVVGALGHVFPITDPNK